MLGDVGSDGPADSNYGDCQGHQCEKLCRAVFPSNMFHGSGTVRRPNPYLLIDQKPDRKKKERGTEPKRKGDQCSRGIPLFFNFFLFNFPSCVSRDISRLSTFLYGVKIHPLLIEALKKCHSQGWLVLIHSRNPFSTRRNEKTDLLRLTMTVLLVEPGTTRSDAEPARVNRTGSGA